MSRKWVLLLLIILPLIALAWFSPDLIRAMAPLHTPQPQSRVGFQLISIPGNATPTPTPFQPAAPTPVFTPEAGPIEQAAVEAPAGTSLATSTPDNPGDNPWEEAPVPTLPSGDRLNLLLLGSDQRPFEGGFRTDSIILVSLNPSAGTASLVSFPRDLYITIPGWTQQRINTAMGYGGFPLLAQTLETNFGVRPTHYVMVNFWAFEQTIDSLDGIEVQVAETLTDHRDQYGQYTVPAGLNHMDGETALWYARSRYSTSDFARTRRQQEILMGLFQRILSLNGLERAPELYEIYADNVTTNLTWQEIAPLLPLAAQLSDTSRIHHYYIGPGQVTSWITPGGAQVLLPNQAAITALLWQALHQEYE